MANSTAPYELPPLPSYTLHLRAPLVAPIPDKYLTLVLPVVAYWGLSMIFHWIDMCDWFPQYRLHTPAEVLRRNHVSRGEVLRDVLIQQVIQTVFGVGLAMIEPPDYCGKEEYDVAVWAQRIRLAQRVIPVALAAVGVDASALASKLGPSRPTIAGALAGGQYPWLQQSLTVQGQTTVVPAFAGWELLAAQALYWFVIPALQFVVAILVVDTWQYFWHRAMHLNKWLYTTFHSRHHRLYVPYAYGALYNHPFEGFLLDTLGAGIAYLVAGMSSRQGMCFFTGSTIKTVDDHCGYALPWDPLQHLTSNNAGYHDIHHQSWGIKTNFSQPFFTFWDRLLGTMWVGGDVSARYEKVRLAAQSKMDKNQYATATSVSQSGDDYRESDALYTNEARNSTLFTPSMQAQVVPEIPAGKATKQAIGSREQVLEDKQGGGVSVLAEEAEEEREAQISLRRSSRKKLSTASAQAGSLKGLRDRVNGSLHGRGGGVLGVESSR